MSESPVAAQPQTVLVKTPSTRPVVTYILIALCVLVYLGQFGSQAYYGFDLLALLGMKINEGILAGQIWRLFTAMFLHGSLVHIAFNMYALYSLGRSIESSYGHLRFTLLYLVGGVAGNVASFGFTPENSLGSSTAIFALLAAEAVFFYQNRQLFARQSSRALSNIASIALVNLVIGFTATNIDNWGHIGGALGGAAFAWLAGPLFKVEGFFPDLELADQRGTNQAWLAATGLGFLLVLIAAVLIFFRQG
jgi:rhomboid protease GluP